MNTLDHQLMNVNRVEHGGTQAGNFANSNIQNPTFNIHGTTAQEKVLCEKRVSVTCCSKQYWIGIFVVLATGIGIVIYSSHTSSSTEISTVTSAASSLANASSDTSTKPPGEA